MFGGYPSFTDVPRLMRAAQAMPGAHAGVGRALRIVSAPVISRMTSPKYAGLFEYGGTPGGAFLLRRGLYMPWELPGILDPEMVREGWAELQTMPRLAATTRGLRGIRTQVSALETIWYMRNQLLRDTDWASMSHSLEIRVPLVDWPLWQRVAPLVASSAGVDKPRMARVVDPNLPAELSARPKTGFQIPTREWLLGAEGERYAARGLRGWARYIYERASRAV
jgi:asparagine synthase (glutamine-hydrolysing)